ncbi:uncharacterized protein [Antedon mediterranea]|uniref:uncharacterized protein isoform X2 n=1 Tax=Antedon mediterranea TaxID=105859 RepID=UPI003AF8BCD9
MAVDFEVKSSGDWGDNGVSDLHAVLFNKESNIDATQNIKHRKKSKKAKTCNTNGCNEISKLEIQRKGKKSKTQDTTKDSKTLKRKLENDDQPEVSKKKKRTLNKKVEQNIENEENTILLNEAKNTEKKIQKKQIKRKKNEDGDGRKLNEGEEKQKIDDEINKATDQLKKKKKRKRKAVNKFKTQEFLNTKKLCGKFVDLTAPPSKVLKQNPKVKKTKEVDNEKSVSQKMSEDEKHSEKMNKKKQKKRKLETGNEKPVSKSQLGDSNSKAMESSKKKPVFDANTKEVDTIKKKPVFDANTKEVDTIKKKPVFDANSKEVESSKKKPVLDLRTKMENKLKGARFRFINEKLYTCTGDSALELFTEDTDAFQVYHDGFVEQVKSWPVNPVDKMIEDLKNMPSSKVVGDFGCGDAKIAESVKQSVYSFDLVSTKANTIACNMAKVPLSDNALDVAVFCLSLMGTNWIDYLKEANRVLKIKGILKIAEVSSRFQNLKAFNLAMKRLGFSQIKKDISNKFFISFDYKKQSLPKEISEGMNEILKPCLYKKR